jgi:hypothetical protein
MVMEGKLETEVEDSGSLAVADTRAYNDFLEDVNTRLRQEELESIVKDLDVPAELIEKRIKNKYIRVSNALKNFKSTYSKLRTDNLIDQPTYVLENGRIELDTLKNYGLEKRLKNLGWNFDSMIKSIETQIKEREDTFQDLQCLGFVRDQYVQFEFIPFDADASTKVQTERKNGRFKPDVLPKVWNALEYAIASGIDITIEYLYGSGKQVAIEDVYKQIRPKYELVKKIQLVEKRSETNG